MKYSDYIDGRKLVSAAGDSYRRFSDLVHFAKELQQGFLPNQFYESKVSQEMDTGILRVSIDEW